MNNNHDSRGRFSSGSSATGDHQQSATPPQSPRLPVASHAGQKSVGTTFRTRAKIKDFPGRQTTTGLRRAARERVALNESVDRSHYPNSSADIRARLKNRATGLN
jgi:hypothetical protein